MNKKKILVTVFILLITFISVFAFIVYQGIREKTENIGNLEVTDISLSSIDDGIYEGSYFYDESIGAKVKVSVKDKQIVDIIFVEHYYGAGKKAESIVNDVITTQSLEVDTISGATASSKVILKSIEDALS